MTSSPHVTPLPWPATAPPSAPVAPSPRPRTTDVVPLGSETLDGVAGAATALSRWYLASPTAEVLAGLADPELWSGWPFADGDATARALVEMQRPHDAASVAEDHAALFVGPHRLLAAPYESVHTSEEGLVFDEATLQVRAWYRHYGLAAPREGREPDDHVGLELEFVATLATWALDAAESGDEASAAVFSAGLQEFTAAHLAVWMPTFTDRVAAHARTDFYRGVAALTRGLVDHLTAPRAAA